MGLWSAGMGSSSGRDNFLFPLVYFLEKHNKTTTTISCPQLQSVMNSGWNASCIHLFSLLCHLFKQTFTAADCTKTTDRSWCAAGAAAWCWRVFWCCSLLSVCDNWFPFWSLRTEDAISMSGIFSFVRSQNCNSYREQREVFKLGIGSYIVKYLCFLGIRSCLP